MSENLILMFHRVHEPRLDYRAEMFYAFLEKIKKQFEIALPFDAPTSLKRQLVLTFDDAYYDFYHYVFPKLKQLKLKAVLAVSPSFIDDTTDVDPTIRLDNPYPEAMFEPQYRQRVPFCTWQELTEMSDSGLVELAAHGFEHHNLADPNTSLEKEVNASKQLIEEKCNTSVRGFIYPFGKCSKERHQQVLKTYDYAMRIGSALNGSWRSTLYRVDAEHFWPNNLPIQAKNLRKWRFKYWLNRLRGK